jgi:hypothetical protein
LKTKVGPSILPMLRVYHNHSFKPFVPPHSNTQNKDTCHATIDSSLIEIESYLDWNQSILSFAADGVLIGNRHLYCTTFKSLPPNTTRTRVRWALHHTPTPWSTTCPHQRERFPLDKSYHLVCTWRNHTTSQRVGLLRAGGHSWVLTSNNQFKKETNFPLSRGTPLPPPPPPV